MPPRMPHTVLMASSWLLSAKVRLRVFANALHTGLGIGQTGDKTKFGRRSSTDLPYLVFRKGQRIIPPRVSLGGVRHATLVACWDPSQVKSQRVEVRSRPSWLLRQCRRSPRLRLLALAVPLLLIRNPQSPIRNRIIPFSPTSFPRRAIGGCRPWFAVTRRI